MIRIRQAVEALQPWKLTKGPIRSNEEYVRMTHDDQLKELMQLYPLPEPAKRNLMYRKMTIDTVARHCLIVSVTILTTEEALAKKLL